MSMFGAMAGGMAGMGGGLMPGIMGSALAADGAGGPLDLYREFNPTRANLESAHNPANAAVPKSGLLEGLLGALQKYPISVATDKFAFSAGGQPVDKSGFDTTEMATWIEQIKAMMKGAKDGKGTEGGPKAGYITSEAKRASPYGSGDAVGGPMFGGGQGAPINPITRRVVAPPQAFGDPFGRTEAPMSRLHLDYPGDYRAGY